MNVNQPHAPSVECMPPEEPDDLIIVGANEARQLSQAVKKRLPVGQMPARQLSDDEWITEHLIVLEENFKAG